MLTSLQEQVLGFIKMLHDSELERKRLRQRVISFAESEQQQKHFEQLNENLQLELSIAKNQVSSSSYNPLVESWSNVEFNYSH